MKWSYFGVYLFIGGTENTKTERMFDGKTVNYILCVLYNAVRKGVRVVNREPGSRINSGLPGS